MFLTQKQKMTTEKYQVGDLVYYYSTDSLDSKKLALIVKTKKLLKLYDILIQTENIYIKDVHIAFLQKAT
jgi:hypothetical protein